MQSLAEWPYVHLKLSKLYSLQRQMRGIDTGSSWQSPPLKPRKRIRDKKNIKNYRIHGFGLQHCKKKKQKELQNLIFKKE
jgi:hypothetical protein